MNHRKRLETCLSGELPDRVPVALWRHFPVDDQKGETLAAAHIDYQKTYDFDFLKVTPASAYSIYDWGVEDEWKGNFEGTRVQTHYPVQSHKDWEKLSILDPQKGHLAETLKALKMIAALPDTPVIQTIFNPLSQARKLVGDAVLLAHMKEHPVSLKKGLEIIVESTRRYIQAASQTGIAGIFFAIQHAQKGVLSWKEYDEFGCQYDLPLLEEASSLWLNVLHLHGDDVYFDELSGYPVAVINWHDRETKPNLVEGKKKFSGAVCGGIRQWDTLTYGTPEQVQAEVLSAIQDTEGRRLILGTGCVAPIISPHGNLMAARRSAEVFFEKQ